MEAICFAIPLAAIAIYGTSPCVPVLLGLAVLLAALYHDWKGGLMAGTASLLLLAAGAWGWTHGILPVGPRVPRLPPEQFDFWMRTMFSQLLAVCAITGVIAYVLRDIRAIFSRSQLAEEKFSRAFRSCPDAMVITELESGRYIDVNDSHERLTGYRREEVLGHTTVELGIFKSKEDRETFAGPLRATGKARRLERQIFDRAGRAIDVLFSAECFELAGKTCVLTIIQDITERKGSEDALLANEQRFRSFIENANVGIYRSTPDGRIIMANPALLKILGYNSFQDLASHNLENGTHEASYPRDEFKARMESAGTLSGWEASWTRRDGKAIFVRESATVVRGADGGILCYDGIIEDISERKKAEQALRESEERFRNLTAAAFEAVVITDNGRIVDINDQGLKLFGCERAEMVGRNALDFVSPGSRRVVGDNIRAQRELTYEHELMRKDGSSFPVEARTKMMQTGGRLLRMTAILDITERQQAEQRQRNLEEQIHNMQKMEALGTLAAGIAHDFNNALAPILMAGPLLRSHVSSPDALHILDMVDKSSTRGAALVRQMLSFARGTAGQKQLLQVRHVLREVIDLAKTTFPKSIQVVSHLPSDMWPVLSDPTQIHQVFLNLCINARDAMPEGGKLTVTAANRTLDSAESATISGARPGNFLAVEVRDTGTGIPLDLLERIWEPFFTTKGEGKGSGLGLSTVRSIVRQHDGFVTVVTSPTGKNGHGTVFTVCLPAVVEGAAGGEAEKQGDQMHRGNGELILLVDDETSVCEIGEKILTRYGYRIVTAHDGADAIKEFIPRLSEVRLLLTDLDMPRVGGRTLVMALRGLNPVLPIITMGGGAGQIIDGQKRVATTFLAKPFDAETLLSVVRRTLDEAGPAAPSPPSV
jgi:PAS domain S-box-containing protein